MSEGLGILFWLLAGLAAVVLSALFAGAETGLYSLNRIRLRLRSESGDLRARLLRRLMRNQRSLLATLLIGNNIANYVGSSAIVGVCSYSTLREWQIAVVVPVIVAPILLIFGEVVPKNIFYSYSDRYTYSIVPLLNWARRVFLLSGLLPLVNLVTGGLMRLTRRKDQDEEGADKLFHPRQQVRRMIRESSHLGTLTPYQSYLVDRVMNLRGVKVVQVMVPLGKVQSVPAEVTRGQFVELVRRSRFSRFPVYRQRPGSLVGVVSANAVLASADPDRPVAEFVYDVPRLKPETPVVHAMFALQRARRAIGIVTDAAGGAVGIVTIKDLVEEVVGEIEEW